MQNPLKQVDRRGLTILIGVFVVLTLVSVIAIVLTVSERNRRDLLSEEDRLRSERQAITNSTSFGLEDYYRDNRDPNMGTVYPARSPESSWSHEEVEKFWINPSEAGLDTLSEDNDALIFESLGIGAAENQR